MHAAGTKGAAAPDRSPHGFDFRVGLRRVDMRPAAGNGRANDSDQSSGDPRLQRRKLPQPLSSARSTRLTKLSAVNQAL